jgi:methionine-S-sulfoxide reductase
MATTQTAIFGAGCFWGIQVYFDQVPGVISTVVGYTGGHTENPTYEDVTTHTTGHAEAVQIEFDPDKISYRDLVRHFFRMHDPTQLNRQGPDVGDNYRSAIFAVDDEQRMVAEEVRDEIQKNYDKPIATQITAASIFYSAEDYHQKFFEKTGIGACHVAYAPLKS